MWLGILGAMSVLLTWFLPVVVRAGAGRAAASAPLPQVVTLGDLLHYRYARLVAGQNDGKLARLFGDLQKGTLDWSDVDRDDWLASSAPARCEICGEPARLSREPLVPLSLRVNDRCPGCATLQSVRNHATLCRACAARKGQTGLYRLFRELHAQDAAFADRIPPRVERHYLQTVRDCLDCAGSLERAPRDASVLDIDAALEPHCPRAA